MKRICAGLLSLLLVVTMFAASSANPVFAEDASELPSPTVTMTGSCITIRFSEEDQAYVQKIKAVQVGENSIERTSEASFDWVSGSRYCIAGTTLKVDGLKDVSADTVFTIIAEGYENLSLVVKEEESSDGKTLHVRLRGQFESAIKNQKGYDAISGASMNVSQNKNSNVIVESALLPEGSEPQEDDWVLLKDSGLDIDFNKTKANIDSDSGMKAVYSPYDSSLTLSGTPAKEGSYPVTVTVKDTKGHSAESNALTFTVFSGQEYLEDRLKTEYCTKFQDGTYKYDMEPWCMVNFTKAAVGKGTVTVPKEIKAWYGSHEEGTYGELGYAVPFGENPTQTLVVPSGCKLSLVNMNIMSSVRIVVEKGASLSLRGTPVQGIVEVLAGGTFSMNHDGKASFERGSAINGQLILRDGATLADSKIYSNTNWVPNGTGQGSYERINTEPVVVMEGTVTLKGTVAIKGDEAASYEGQKALRVKGTLQLEDGAVLAVYGGGMKATTSIGAPALQLENGSVVGKGKIIAVGGTGYHNQGGNAVEGNGTIATEEAYLEGGMSVMPKNDSVKPGLAKAESVVLAESTNCVLKDGSQIKTSTDPLSETQWSDITTMPDFSLYKVPSKDPAAPSPAPAPKTVSASLTKYNAAKIRWTKVSEASGYMVYYRSSTASKYSLLVKTTATSCSKSGLKPGKKYSVKVVPYKEVGDGIYTSSHFKTATFTTLKKLESPKVTKSGKNFVKVFWTNIAGESGYQISKSSTKKGTKIVATCSTTSGKYKKVKATYGKTYYYKVRAYKTENGKKVYAPWSSVTAFRSK